MLAGRNALCRKTNKRRRESMKLLTRKRRRGERKETLDQRAHDGEMGEEIRKVHGHGDRRMEGRRSPVERLNDRREEGRGERE